MDVTWPWTRSPPRSSGCRATWPRSTPGFLGHLDAEIGACSTTWRRRASARTRWRSWSPQRRQRRGRPATAESTSAWSRTGTRRDQREPGDARRAGRPQDGQPLPQRRAMVFNRRSTGGSATSSTAARQTRASSPGPPASRPRARSASSTTTPSTSSRRFSTRSASSHPRPSGGTPRAISTASACATASTRRRCPALARRSSSRCSARAASGTTAGRPSPPTRR